ncbi:hypothetical protein VTL71DRAFT_96 [Oculimacula yallundae]|uniref:Uncharacterized protein n=1 Tax=Oculimacula yallundae TaxID=86028 RepID=A0ABR4D1E6_9HELO
MFKKLKSTLSSAAEKCRVGSANHSNDSRSNLQPGPGSHKGPASYQSPVFNTSDEVEYDSDNNILDIRQACKINTPQEGMPVPRVTWTPGPVPNPRLFPPPLPTVSLEEPNDDTAIFSSYRSQNTTSRSHTAEGPNPGNANTKGSDYGNVDNAGYDQVPVPRSQDRDGDMRRVVGGNTSGEIRSVSRSCPVPRAEISGVMDRFRNTDTRDLDSSSIPARSRAHTVAQARYGNFNVGNRTGNISSMPIRDDSMGHRQNTHGTPSLSSGYRTLASGSRSVLQPAPVINDPVLPSTRPVASTNASFHQTSSNSRDKVPNCGNPNHLFGRPAEEPIKDYLARKTAEWTREEDELVAKLEREKREKSRKHYVMPASERAQRRSEYEARMGDDAYPVRVKNPGLRWSDRQDEESG